jgi:hypothetical protein
MKQVTTDAQNEMMPYSKHYFKVKSWIWLSMVAHGCNPCYSGGGEWEDYNSRPTQD